MTLRAFDHGEASTQDALDALDAYNAIAGAGEKRSYRSAYTRTLETAPWRTCTCGICEEIGIEVAIFRGSERNKRRGFHNLAVFRKRLNDLGFPSLRT